MVLVQGDCQRELRALKVMLGLARKTFQVAAGRKEQACSFCSIEVCLRVSRKAEACPNCLKQGMCWGKRKSILPMLPCDACQWAAKQSRMFGLR